MATRELVATLEGYRVRFSFFFAGWGHPCFWGRRWHDSAVGCGGLEKLSPKKIRVRSIQFLFCRMGSLWLPHHGMARFCCGTWRREIPPSLSPGHMDAGRSVSFSPDGATLASGVVTFTVLLWDVATREIIATLEDNPGTVNSVSFSPDGATLAAGTWHNILLWDVATGEIVATLEGHADWVNSVSFSLDGATLASASEDGTVKLWDVATGGIVATLEGHTDRVNSVSFSPDGLPWLPHQRMAR